MFDGFGTTLHNNARRKLAQGRNSAARAVTSPKNGRRPSVMIAGPDHPEHNQVKQYLIDEGYRVYHEQLGRLAVEEVRQLHPDVVLVDTHLPDESAVHICERLMADPDASHIPVLLLTEESDEDARAAGLQAGGADWIQLPCPREELLVRVSTQVRLRKNVQAVEEQNAQLEQLLVERTKELILSERKAALGMFVDGVVHNMNNPLTCISGSIQMLQMKLQQLERMDEKNVLASIPKQAEIFHDIEKRLTTIEKSSQRLIGMVASMLHRNHAEIKEKQVEINLHNILQQELEYFEADLWFKHHVQRQVLIGDEPAVVHAVPAVLSQVVQNLIQNAIDAVRNVAEPEIILQSGRQDSRAFLRIQDNGVGIEAEQMPYIYDPFFTTKAPVDERDDHHSPGTGLGLFMCREFIEGYGGSVQMQSQAGQGAEITIWLPLTAQEETIEHDKSECTVG